MGSLAVLGLKPGHDGAAALIADGELVYSLEGEKDAGERNGVLTAPVLLEALEASPVFPDAFAVGGWHKVLPGRLQPVAAGYRGLEPGQLGTRTVFGREVAVYTSSHERSHLFGGVAMSPFDPESEIAILVWEGIIGSFYRWRGPRTPIEPVEVLNQPGARFAAFYCLADETFPDTGSWPRLDAAGKLMALVGLADDKPPTTDSVNVVESLLKARALYPFSKIRYRSSPLHNRGVTDPEFCRAARYLSGRIFDLFCAAAVRLFGRDRLPLVISGGCGLNCDWNSAWKSSDLFTDVSVAPCTNDSGSAIGTAVDAAVQLGGACKLGWDVYRGTAFVEDVVPDPAAWAVQPLDLGALSQVLADGAVVAWVQGRYEIGPRALGNRSLLASAADPLSHKRLNAIKQRESYRPIAPVCLEEDLGVWFDSDQPDPHMLFFRRVKAPERIPAVTHVDGSARVQSVTAHANPRLHDLLRTHRQRFGLGVLCNTSLNFKGTGFINRASELFHYCDWVGVDHVVVGERWYVRTASTTSPPVGPGPNGALDG